MNPPALVDTNAILALLDRHDPNHAALEVSCPPQTTEFAAIRGKPAFSVTDSYAGFGYVIAPGAIDNNYPANQSARNFHTADVIATVYKPTEYSDRTNNALGDCAMNASVLANSENIDRKDVVLYYRASVRDSTANNWALPGGGFAPVFTETAALASEP